MPLECLFGDGNGSALVSVQDLRLKRYFFLKEDSWLWTEVPPRAQHIKFGF